MDNEKKRYQRTEYVKSSNMPALLAKDKQLKIQNEEKGRLDGQSPTYKATADAHKGAMLADNLMQVSNAVSRKQLRNIKAVNLDDLNEVIDKTEEYFASCAAAQHFPSMLTYTSIGLGISRSKLNNYMNTHKNEVTDYLERVRDLIADVLTNASLYGNADTVSVIFQLKNLHGFADKINLDTSVSIPEVQYDKEAIRRRHTFKDITPPEEGGVV